ncbi:Na/Pi cotransporter family protein [sulfur-oxidizing endosymbiont of Gigantopelta aegis]|uniref:Na/Pi cotransporter family protein n=1 Tax=sulfur-oxidizing endosymbiont of Gigantopelta aegis TaxID=2794934 RepID=UPI001BE4DAA2|nr:Na/Pi cotransporter family protein [sulfur-oxidizing endosymbiont of Gigantopelta aegis]
MTLTLCKISGFIFLLMLFSGSPFAFAASTDVKIDWLQLALGLFGGLALFLAGLQLLSEGMKKAAGDAMTKVLSHLTTNRFMGAITGAFVTGILNSSTVTTLLVVGFISSGMMTLAQSVGVIMGANIGSTVTAQLLAFDLAAYSLGPVAIGFFMLFTAKKDKVKYYGMMIMGIGLVFYGMGLMSHTMTPLRTYQPFLDILVSLEKPMAGILAGAIFTAIVQSSAATIGIAIAMASEGLLSLPAGIALALGANIGTAITTAIMGVMSSKSTQAVQASVVHVVFNVVGVLIWLPLIWLLVDIAVWLSPAEPELTGLARAGAEVPRQIANANTFFNIINTLIFIGFTTWFARLAEFLVPERKAKVGVIITPKFIDKNALVSTPIALQQVRLELGRMGDITSLMLDEIFTAYKNGNMQTVIEIAKRYDEVDILEEEILHYLGLIRRGELSEHDSDNFQQLMIACDNFESIADVVRNELQALAHKACELKPKTGKTTQILMKTLHQSVVKALELTVIAIRDDDQKAAESVISMRKIIAKNSNALLSRKAIRLGTNDPDYLKLVRVEMAFVEQMRRIYTLTKRIAKNVPPPIG